MIEVNVHPSRSWRELSELTHTLFRIAREQRLGTETSAWTAGTVAPVVATLTLGAAHPIAHRCCDALTCWSAC